MIVGKGRKDERFNKNRGRGRGTRIRITRYLKYDELKNLSHCM
jgi:hypothetical protein